MTVSPTARLGWGGVSDKLGRQNTYILFGLAAPVWGFPHPACCNRSAITLHAAYTLLLSNDVSLLLLRQVAISMPTLTNMAVQGEGGLLPLSVFLGGTVRHSPSYGACIRQQGWHFSCERGCTRDDYGKAGPFSVERLKMGLPFVNVLSVQTSTQRSAGPLHPPPFLWACFEIAALHAADDG